MELTPMRVRGKRGNLKKVKEHLAKERKASRSSSSTASSRTSSARSTPSADSASSRRRRKKRVVELSRLEELPTEILQTIFEYSANLELPLASPRLASQLASRHLYHSLTSIILQPKLGKRPSRDSTSSHRDEYLRANCSAARRLMSSKFFTWPFFRSWLHEKLEVRLLLPEWQKIFFNAFSTGVDNVSVDQREQWIWAVLAHPILPPPVKLLRGPFTQDKIEFLRFLTRTFGSRNELDAIYIERAKEGLRQAVCEGATEAVPSFWHLGLQPDTELLRLAVIDSGCDKELVRSLVNRIYNMTTDPLDIDFLDPALWMWAEKAQESGNEKGPWLRGLLKHAARVSSRIDAA